MMFVTDLTDFAENGFFPELKAWYKCTCESGFEVKIAEGQTFHVKCGDCGQKAVVNTKDIIDQYDDLYLNPVFILEGAEFKEIAVHE